MKKSHLLTQYLDTPTSEQSLDKFSCHGKDNLITFSKVLILLIAVNKH